MKFKLTKTKILYVEMSDISYKGLNSQYMFWYIHKVTYYMGFGPGI